MLASNLTTGTRTSAAQRYTAIFIFLTVILTSCGGGSSSDSSDNPGTGNDLDNGTDPEPITYSIKLEWDTPNERQNGEPMFLWELSGYEITYSEEGESGLTTINIESASTTEETIEDLEEGVYQFWIATIDTENQVSNQSEALTIDLAN